MNDIKKWFHRIIRSKTMHTANIIMILGIIQSNSDFLSTILNPKQFGFVMMVIAVVMGLLRIQTTNSLEDK